VYIASIVKLFWQRKFLVMIIESFEGLSEDIKKRAEVINFNLHGPEEIQYGFGWEPTITFWDENRRVHFYFDSSNQEGLNVEVAEIQPRLKITRRSVKTNSLVKRAIIKTPDEAWEIIDNFLRQKCDFEKLPVLSWAEDTNDVDKFIPHPPNLGNPANMVSLVDKLEEIGEVWRPEKSKKQSPWKNRLKSWFNK
jgi:hypothetical protein